MNRCRVRRIVVAFEMFELLEDGQVESVDARISFGFVSISQTFFICSFKSKILDVSLVFTLYLLTFLYGMQLLSAATPAAHFFSSKSGES